MSKNESGYLTDIEKLRSVVKNMLFLAITLESTTKLVKTKDSDKHELSNYVVNTLEEVK